MCLVLLFACSDSSKLNKALNDAGQNRHELESVLTHYSSNPADSQKLRAAKFLIENMPGHCGYELEKMQKYCEIVVPLQKAWLTGEQKKEVINETYKKFIKEHGRIEVVEDIKVITAEYLIYNIELAFDQWENHTWARHLDFDQFCELILPYRCIDGQPLDYWKDTVAILYKDKIEALNDCDFYKGSVYEAARVVHNALKNAVNPVLIDNREYPFVGAASIAWPPYGNCYDYAIATMAVLRGNGVPIATDFTTQWANKGIGHTWNSLMLNEGVVMKYGGISDSEPGIAHKPYEKIAKAYRYTYARNEELVAMNNLGEVIPEEFNNIFFKDVTSDYMKTADIRIPIVFNNRSNKYAYLMISDGSDWVPIAYGNRLGNSMEFKRMGLNHLYLPVFYNSRKEYVPTNNPFHLTYSGEVKYFNPDTVNTITLYLERKYNVRTYVHGYGSRIVGGKLQVSDNPNFKDARTVYEINSWQSQASCRLDTVSAYRYWRYLTPDGGHCNISELMLFAPEDSTRRLTGKIINTKINHDVIKPENAFDGDILTYFGTDQTCDSWIGLDFGEPQKVSKAIIYPVTDGNNIELHDVYELFYYGQTGWISLGKQIATDIYLTYKNVPSNAVYLLKDLTKGAETRFFTYENGKQVWW